MPAKTRSFQANVIVSSSFRKREQIEEKEENNLSQPGTADCLLGFSLLHMAVIFRTKWISVVINSSCLSSAKLSIRRTYVTPFLHSDLHL